MVLEETKIIKTVSSELGIKKDKLLEEMLKTYVDKAISDLINFENNLKSKYRSKSPNELKEKIKNGDVTEHPSWEDYLTWKSIEKSLKKYKMIRKRVIHAE